MEYEILAPAGGEQSAYVALKSGADAVYLGLSRFSARANAENFDLSALKRVVTFAHLLNAKVYVALNTVVKDSETEAFFQTAVDVYNAGADGILLQDIFLGKRLKECYPQMTLHLSTQAGCCNEYGARLAKEYGFSRVVLARETPLSEIAKICKIIQTEVFVQGALCSCFSGQCYFSSFVGNNSGNRGRCKQPCRKRYSIDRNGYEEAKYALSLADLSVGGRVKELLDAGVYSLKIEGRMRREEYVFAAVNYYRTLLEGGDVSSALSTLKRTYNRGDYTHGLAFGQSKNFISRRVQGHIGERVGTLTQKKGKFFCKSNYKAQSDDGFKLLRSGEEVGGATLLYAAEDGFYLTSSERMAVGDEVRVTTDSSITLDGLSRTREVQISLTFLSGKRARVEGEGVFLEGEILPPARSAPLSEDALKACFVKTDGLPLSIRFSGVKTDGVFMAKSQLNELRRAFFGKLVERLAPIPDPLSEVPMSEVIKTEQGGMVAVIAPFVPKGGDVYVCKPNDYGHIPCVKDFYGEKYLYLPPFFTAEDEQIIRDKIEQFDGFYGEGFYALALAKKYGKKLFAGTGFQLTNRFSVAGVLAAGASYFALSKELDCAEQRALAGRGAFALTAGSIKLMDLVYCPFSGECKSCDRRQVYTLTDEGGREFPLRRYRASGERCRFEVYNCVSLAAYNEKTSAIVDLSVERSGEKLVEVAFSPEGVKRVAEKVTGGHANRSLL